MSWIPHPDLVGYIIYVMNTPSWSSGCVCCLLWAVGRTRRCTSSNSAHSGLILDWKAYSILKLPHSYGRFSNLVDWYSRLNITKRYYIERRSSRCSLEDTEDIQYYTYIQKRSNSFKVKLIQRLWDNWTLYHGV